VIDIHTHVLPGVDDGPQTIESSLEILKKAADAGVTKVVATPHVVDSASVYNDRGIGDALAAVKNRLVQEGITIELLRGAELFLAPELGRRLEEQKDLTLNGTGRYVLVELPVYEIPLYTEQTLFDLSVQGVVPILAHPERYFDIQKNPDRLQGLIEKGVLTQLNIGSITGAYGRRVQKAAKTLLAKKLIHMVASDVHACPNGDYPLQSGFAALAAVAGPDSAREMVTGIPEKIIKGEDIRSQNHTETAALPEGDRT